MNDRNKNGLETEAPRKIELLGRHLWDGPDGWFIKGVPYNRGDYLRKSVPEVEIAFFRRLGYIAK